MHKALPYKTKQFFFVLIKLSIVVGAFYFIYNKIVNNSALSFSYFIDFLLKNNLFSTKNITFLMILSIFNWIFEILKWKILVSFIKKITFKDALKQSLGALTASLFTPNRIAEYGAKAMYYISNFRKQIMLVNLISNFLQMSVTTILGVIGFSFYILKYDPDLNYYKIARFLVFVVLAIVLLGLGITKSRFTVKGFSLEKIKRFIVEYPKAKLATGFLLSLIRYAIFSFQFYFLLLIFKTDLNYLDAMIIITSMYLLASIIPSIFIFDVVIKGSIAVYLFSFAGVNELIILCIISLMWILNFVIPSLFGSYYILSYKLPKTKDLQ
ncbi:lysylphosphatidylglycerol synthase domain-containing protein [uncultured Algibacter sp.]|uniref:lysylphosphatidylglycerol synthase domain-containing protein n=1 Tax=uncultured Algibacter sp. TaxID=298659 RepID=UPI002627C996|nr:lysylphosphatidylglycerol synthase domain-containing protein [uncultured Algibacter sp.]